MAHRLMSCMIAGNAKWMHDCTCVCGTARIAWVLFVCWQTEVLCRVSRSAYGHRACIMHAGSMGIWQRQSPCKLLTNFRSMVCMPPRSVHQGFSCTAHARVPMHASILCRICMQVACILGHTPAPTQPKTYRRQPASKGVCQPQSIVHDEDSLGMEET